MQLKLSRSQREGGTLSKSIIFCLDARAQFTPDERANVERYRIGNQVLYNSESSRRHLDHVSQLDAGTASGFAKSALHLLAAKLSLNITINSLQQGQHIECKSLDELLGAEEALMEACQALKTYLDTAATFDGREVLFNFDGGEPTLAAPSMNAPPQLAIPAPTAGDAARETQLHREATPPPDAPAAYATSGAAATADTFDSWPPQGPPAPFELWLARQRQNWTNATTGQKALIVGGGLVALYITSHIL